MRILTVIVSYNRLPLLKRTFESYQATVTGPHYLMIVDNASNKATRRWLENNWGDCIYLNENRYPGYAANLGWGTLLRDHRKLGADTLLHRSDNDVEYLPGWANHVRERFATEPDLGQLGLRTLEEEGPHAAVGGNCVLRRNLFEQGYKYAGQPWHENAFEDAQLSALITGSGYRWARATQPCVVHLGVPSSTDPYYQQTFRERGISFSAWGAE